MTTARRLPRLAALVVGAALFGACQPAAQPAAPAPPASAAPSPPQPSEPPPPPEPAGAPPTEEAPVGRVVAIGPGPEGVVADPATGLVAVAVDDPGRIVLADGASGRVVREVGVPGTVRHLGLAAPGGPVLVPTEGANVLVQIGLPRGDVVSETPVGRFPHDAAGGAGRAFTANEFGDSASVVERGRVIATLPAPLQPGSVAVTDGGVLGVVGVRGLAMDLYEARTLAPLGRLPVGDGPTHVVAGPDERLYVADTRGGAIIVCSAAAPPTVAQRVPTPGGGPYGIAVDAQRRQLWVGLTATNQLVQYAITEAGLRQLAVYPTVRQPNDVAVDPGTGRVYITGTADGQLQIVTPPS